MTVAWDEDHDDSTVARKTARWLFDQGFPFDWSSDRPPPATVSMWLVDYWYADNVKEGVQMTHDEVKAWLWEEAQW